MDFLPAERSELRDFELEHRQRALHTMPVVVVDVMGELALAFERHFLQLLVPYVEDEMLKRVRDEGAEKKFRAETLRFVADPQIFSDVCGLICDAAYDFLYNEGFLDLPGDWRQRLADAG